MTTTKAAVYLRVSTKDQSVDSQRDEIERIAANRGLELTYYEDQASGASSSRKGLDEMMADLRRGRFKVVICYKLDRLGRSLPHLAQLISEFDACGVGFIVAGQGIDTTESNPAARLQLHVLMAIADFERELIRERTKAGLEAAKRRGKTLGRPKGATSLPSRRRLHAERILVETPDLSCAKLARAVGVSVGTAWKWKRKLSDC